MKTRACAAIWLGALVVVMGACRESPEKASEPSLASAGAAAEPSRAAPSASGPPSAPASPSATFDTALPVWEGTSRGLRIRWTERDLTVRAEGSETAPNFSLGEYLREEYTKNGALNQKLCRWEEKVRVLSVVGTIISIERAMYSECARAAHPGGETRYLALDFQGFGAGQRSPRRAELSDFFPATTVVETFLRDGVVRKALASARSPDESSGGYVPRSPADLVKHLSTIHVGEPCADFPLDLMGRFTFHHVDRQKIAVRVGLPGSGPCRDELTQLGLNMPIPASLSASVASAAARREGFLTQDADAIAKGHTARFDFGSSVESIEKARHTLP